MHGAAMVDFLQFLFYVCLTAAGAFYVLDKWTRPR
jgi:hypothetical protein